MKFIKSIVFYFIIFLSQMVNAQQDSIYVLDKVIAVVGDEIVLKSDVEQRKVQMRQEGVQIEGNYE